jgi:hypothetical protein
MKDAFLWFVLLLASCRSNPVQLVGGEVRNRTPEPILDFCAVHEPTGRVVTVNHILAGMSFVLGFQPRELKTRTAFLTWRTARGQACAKTIEITPPSEELREGPCWLVYTIAGPTAASFHWERPPPSYGNTSLHRP